MTDYDKYSGEVVEVPVLDQVCGLNLSIGRVLTEVVLKNDDLVELTFVDPSSYGVTKILCKIQVHAVDEIRTGFSRVSDGRTFPTYIRFVGKVLVDPATGDIHRVDPPTEMIDEAGTGDNPPL